MYTLLLHKEYENLKYEIVVSIFLLMFIYVFKGVHGYRYEIVYSTEKETLPQTKSWHTENKEDKDRNLNTF